MMLFSAHFLGCMFVLLRDSNLEASGDENNWLDAYDPELRDKDNLQRYVACLYWAIATVSTIGISLPPISTLGYVHLLD